MQKCRFSAAMLVASVALLGTVAPTHAAGLASYVRGAVIEYGYGPGTSSNRPRVEMRVALCGSGQYQTQGRSCRPNIIARGYQCSNFRDSGKWRVQGNTLQWMSSKGQPGALQLYRNGRGFADRQGNPVVRVGNAGC